MHKSIVFLLILIFTTAVIIVPSAFALEQNGVIEMPFTENPPAIDGKWTTKDEWSDASQTTIGSGNNVGILLVKHDRDYLYVMGDMVRDFSEDRVGIFNLVFDTNNNGGNKPDSEDISVWINYWSEISTAEWYEQCSTLDEKGTKIIFACWGSSGGKIPSSASSTTNIATNDPFESVLPHIITEIKIPLSYLGKSDKYGFAMMYADSKSRFLQYKPIPDNAVLWPETVQRTVPHFAVPDFYGTLIDSKNQVTIPPIPVMSLSSTSLSFGNEEVSEKSSPKTITISNQGTSVLKINSIRASGEFSIPDLKTPMEIQPSQSASLGVVFVPITVGEKSGTVTISSNDLSKPTMTVSLSGKGVEKSELPLGGGCLIATATFGSELAPQVQLLRELRDNAVLGTDLGTSFTSAFNQFYYSFSPTVADWERQNPFFRESVKMAITPMLSTLMILNYVEINSEQEMLGYGVGIILLNLGLYIVAPAVVILKIRRTIL